jgi:hypothetical protein
MSAVLSPKAFTHAREDTRLYIVVGRATLEPAHRLLIPNPVVR